MPYFQHASGEIYYEELGSGPPLLLLRGLGRSSRYWLGFETVLAKRFRVIMMDQRGLGRTKIPATWGDSLGDSARDALALMDARGVRGFHIFGLSLGGMVALELAFLEPARVLSLVVANSSSRDSGLWRINPWVLPSLLRGTLRGSFHLNLLECLTDPQLSAARKDEISMAWNAIRTEEGFPLLTILKQMLMAGRFAIGQRQLAPGLPLLILAGEADRFVPPEHSQRLAELLGAYRYQRISSAGHEITIHHEEEIASLIWHFTQEPLRAKESRREF